MKRSGLVYKDGFLSTTPWLRSEVRFLQKVLNQSGAKLETDGYYGDECRAAVTTFQEKTGLSATGQVDAATWEALEPHAAEVNKDMTGMIRVLLPRFRGDLDWIHLLEGHRGNAYWPGGSSGVTLDPGVDLGHVPPDQVRSLYGGDIAESQYKVMKKAYGVFGEDAEALLAENRVLQGVSVSRKKAEAVMPFASKPYWRAIADRFSVLSEEDTFPAVQTVLLSLAYNRGSDNEDLKQLEEPLAARQWRQVAELVEQMQQNHKLEGIRKRRRWEGALILTHLDRLG